LNYNTAQLIALAQTCPQELMKILIDPNVDTKMLTSGVEVFCEEVQDENLILSALRLLLKSKNALVRESAIIGVTGFYIDNIPPQDILDKLKIMSNVDPSPFLKEYAGDAFDKYSAE
jgi:hypothetical protein